MIAENEYRHIEKQLKFYEHLDAIVPEPTDLAKECFLANGLGMRLRLTEFSLLKCQIGLP